MMAQDKVYDMSCLISELYVKKKDIKSLLTHMYGAGGEYRKKLLKENYSEIIDDKDTLFSLVLKKEYKDYLDNEFVGDTLSRVGELSKRTEGFIETLTIKSNYIYDAFDWLKYNGGNEDDKVVLKEIKDKFNEFKEEYKKYKVKTGRLFWVNVLDKFIFVVSSVKYGMMNKKLKKESAGALRTILKEIEANIFTPKVVIKKLLEFENLLKNLQGQSKQVAGKLRKATVKVEVKGQTQTRIKVAQRLRKEKEKSA